MLILSTFRERKYLSEREEKEEVDVKPVLRGVGRVVEVWEGEQTERAKEQENGHGFYDSERG